MIAILIPCYNEEQTIGKVITDFSKELPDANIYVYDNASSDKTAEIAKKKGVIVRNEPKKGKGNVVKSMFKDINADYYILVDGDDTYDAKSIKKMLEYSIENKIDMLTGIRIHNDKKAYRFGHVFGNRVLTGVVKLLFKNNIKDLLSGYRIFSKDFVKSFPAHSHGFEIETELSIHAIQLNMKIAEIETPYYERPTGSYSKLNTYKDGIKILITILKLLKYEKPGVVMNFITTMILFLNLFKKNQNISLIGIITFISGLILDSITLTRKEAKILNYVMKKNT